MRRLLECPFAVELAAQNLRIPLKTLADLTPGDVVTFTRPASELASLRIAGAEMFRAAPVRSGEQRAARLVAAVSSPLENAQLMEERSR